MTALHRALVLASRGALALPQLQQPCTRRPQQDSSGHQGVLHCCTGVRLACKTPCVCVCPAHSRLGRPAQCAGNSPCAGMLRTVDGQEHELLGLGDLDEFVQVHEDAQHHLCLCQAQRGVVRVRAVVDDAVHVEVQVVDLRGRLGRCHGHIKERIPLAQPPVELWYPCVRVCVCVQKQTIFVFLSCKVDSVVMTALLAGKGHC